MLPLLAEHGASCCSEGSAATARTRAARRGAPIRFPSRAAYDAYLVDDRRRRSSSSTARCSRARSSSRSTCDEGARPRRHAPHGLDARPDADRGVAAGGGRRRDPARRRRAGPGGARRAGGAGTGARGAGQQRPPPARPAAGGAAGGAGRCGGRHDPRLRRSGGSRSADGAAVPRGRRRRVRAQPPAVHRAGAGRPAPREPGFADATPPSARAHRSRASSSWTARSPPPTSSRWGRSPARSRASGRSTPASARTAGWPCSRTCSCGRRRP